MVFYYLLLEATFRDSKPQCSSTSSPQGVGEWTFPSFRYSTLDLNILQKNHPGSLVTDLWIIELSSDGEKEPRSQGSTKQPDGQEGCPKWAGMSFACLIIGSTESNLLGNLLSTRQTLSRGVLHQRGELIQLASVPCVDTPHDRMSDDQWRAWKRQFIFQNLTKINMVKIFAEPAFKQAVGSEHTWRFWPEECPGRQDLEDFMATGTLT
ncbi:hypothetical protein B0T11DRAFT_279710 [Plectosphaerella cucumerina]|uniref:Uncharacterized protein n=1 Tax=Plectosphaerella cucumerina TaxID=40658 RepID=A0A8K0TI27_9PEZI|nr:hypothetical protein B0T11DRAFT_279710 [Plectosphaerella cucumerina]